MPNVNKNAKISASGSSKRTEDVAGQKSRAGLPTLNKDATAPTVATVAAVATVLNLKSKALTAPPPTNSTQLKRGSIKVVTKLNKNAAVPEQSSLSTSAATISSLPNATRLNQTSVVSDRSPDRAAIAAVKSKAKLKYKRKVTKTSVAATTAGGQSIRSTHSKISKIKKSPPTKNTTHTATAAASKAKSISSHTTVSKDKRVIATKPQTRTKKILRKLKVQPRQVNVNSAATGAVAVIVPAAGGNTIARQFARSKSESRLSGGGCSEPNINDTAAEATEKPTNKQQTKETTVTLLESSTVTGTIPMFPLKKIRYVTPMAVRTVLSEASGDADILKYQTAAAKNTISNEALIKANTMTTTTTTKTVGTNTKLTARALATSKRLAKDDEQEPPPTPTTSKGSSAKKRKINDENTAKTSSETATAAGPSTSTEPADDDKEKDDEKESKKKKNRCAECRKKVGLTGFECRCGGLYCAVHRYSDKHDCTFNYREHGAQEIRRNNPVVVGEKIQKI